jgi:hypothetical protein
VRLVSVDQLGRMLSDAAGRTAAISALAPLPDLEDDVQRSAFQSYLRATSFRNEPKNGGRPHYLAALLALGGRERFAFGG